MDVNNMININVTSKDIESKYNIRQSAFTKYLYDTNART